MSWFKKKQGPYREPAVVESTQPCCEDAAKLERVFQYCRNMAAQAETRAYKSAADDYDSTAGKHLKEAAYWRKMLKTLQDVTAA